jgi:hypothetical protein
MQILPLLTCIAIGMLSASCANFRPTPYQPIDGGRYGYSEEWVAPGEYRISVAGNDATSAEMLWHQLLYRAAEITLERGHEYFAVVPVAGGALAHIEPAFLMPQFGVGPVASFSARSSGIRASVIGTPLLRYPGYPVGVEPSRQLIATGTIVMGEKQQRSEYVFKAEEVKAKLKSQVTFL